MASELPTVYTVQDLEKEIKGSILTSVQTILAEVKDNLQKKQVEIVKKKAKELKLEIGRQERTLSQEGEDFLQYLQTYGQQLQSDGTEEEKKRTTINVVRDQPVQQPDEKAQVHRPAAPIDKDKTTQEMSSGKQGEAGSQSLVDGSIQGDPNKKPPFSATYTVPSQAMKQDPSGEKDYSPEVLRCVQKLCSATPFDISEDRESFPKDHPGFKILTVINRWKNDYINEMQDKDKEIKEMKEQKETDEKKQKIEIESQKADFLEREKNYKKNIEGLQTDLDAEKRQNKTLNQNAGELRKYSQSLEKSNSQLQKQVEECDRQILDLNEHITNLRGENKQLKSRVSELAGAKLMDNNPDIADLSDPNRALKLGEKFSSLYDDDWTDAFQTLTEKYQMKDHETIRLLLDILLRSYQHCRKVADEQMDSLYNIFENPCQNIPEMLTKFPKDKTQLTQKQHKDLKDLRKRIALNLSESVAKQFLNKEYEEAKKKGDRKQKKILDETKIYYEKCVEVCWPMVLHDPPVNLEMKVNPGVKIDGNRFRLYGGNGDTLEYLVWPPLVVEGGGLLAKGVAKPKEVKRTEKKP